jgi:hypothetical protein
MDNGQDQFDTKCKNLSVSKIVNTINAPNQHDWQKVRLLLEDIQ